MNLTELKDIIIELDNSFSMSDFEFLFEKKLIESNNDYISLLPFVYEVFAKKEYMQNLK